MAMPSARLRIPPVRGLGRSRLAERLAALWDHRLGLVVAPAGSGKTTVLVHFASMAGAPVAWYRAEGADAAEATFLAHLERAATAVVEGLSGGWTTVEEAAVDLASVTAAGGRALLVVDDLHQLHGTPAEGAVARLVDELPPGIPLLVATRRMPSFSLSRLRVSGDLLELSADDLRFRSWEVEQLFRDVYGESLPPDDLTQLTRRVEGWAAGLQLFHLASRGKPAVERRRLVAALSTRSRLVREYLTENVLGELPEHLRTFLVRTCVLGRLTGTVCDELLGRTGSEAILEDLERSQLFTVPVDAPPDGLETARAWRYHEVLRSHLEAALVADVGEVAARASYQRAGQLLEAASAPLDAIRAYCRAEDWEAVGRLLGEEGEALVGDPGAWVDSLPAALVAEDPWLVLASARRALAHGRLQAAADTYSKAEGAFGNRRQAEVARAERAAVRPWLTARPERASGWSALLRAATMRDPLVSARDAALLPGPTGRLTEGLALLLAGRADEAQAVCAGVAEQADAAPSLAVAALAIAAVAPLWGAREAVDPAEAEELAEGLGVPWASRLCAAVSSVLGGRDDQTARLLEAVDREGDRWGGALLSLLRGLAQLAAGKAPVDILDDAVVRLRHLGADVLEAWARAAHARAVAREGRPDALELATEAAAAARAVGAHGAVVLAHLAAAEADGDSAAMTALAREVARDWQVALPLLEADPAPIVQVAPVAPAPSAPPAPEPTPVDGVVLRCFGGFELVLDGVVVDATSVKPRPRAALHLLALHAPRALHRETLIEALWPEADPVTGTRNLQTAISSLRALLEPDASRGSYTFLVREGDAYRLALPERADADLVAFEDALAAGRAALATGDHLGAMGHLGAALERYRGELLPEDGPAEWVVKPRERLRADAADAAARLAEVALEHGDATAAVTACDRGLHVDRYRDALWRLLIEANKVAGDHAAAARAERDYAAVLAELGIG